MTDPPDNLDDWMRTQPGNFCKPTGEAMIVNGADFAFGTPTREEVFQENVGRAHSISAATAELSQQAHLMLMVIAGEADVNGVAHIPTKQLAWWMREREDELSVVRARSELRAKGCIATTALPKYELRDP